MSKRTWYDRTEIKRVTPDWVKTNVRITNREKELLQIISDRKLVRRDMLEIISPSYRHLGDNRTRIINRSINKMFKNMVVDKVHEPQEFMKGNKPAVIALDRAGAVTLGIPFKQRIKHDKSVVRGVEYIHRSLPANYRHINGVNQLEVDTIQFCERKDVEISQWVLEKPIELFYGGERVSLIPDVLMELKKPTGHLNAFIEYDTGSENTRYKEPPIIRDKIIKYRKYMLSRIWEREFEKFPIVIFVSVDIDRVKFWNNSCKKNGVMGLGVRDDNWISFLERLSESI